MLWTIILSFLSFIIIRILYLIYFRGKSKFSKKNVRTLIVIGSGGHTTEMLMKVKTLNPNLYGPRLYVMADSDTSSEHKIKALEADFQYVSTRGYKIVTIPRSRMVNQSYFTSVFSTLYSTLMCVPVVFTFNPDLILCNGPGTCIPICVIGLLLKVLFITETQIVFIESICRVKSLSLSGRILLHFADCIIVQWPYLHDKYPKTIYLGRII